MTKRMKFILLSPLFLTGFLLLIALGGEIVRQLWNWLAPSLFGVRDITFWEALGLLALSRILVGGFGLRSGGDSRTSSRRCRHDRIGNRIADRIADRVGERWDRMTPEERDRFRQRIRERCGFDPGTRESTG